MRFFAAASDGFFSTGFALSGRHVLRCCLAALRADLPHGLPAVRSKSELAVPANHKVVQSESRAAVRRIPEDLRTELTAAFQRYFERLFFCWAAVECLVVIPFFSARKLWSFAIVAVLLATFIALPRSLRHFGHVRIAGWTPAVSGGHDDRLD